MAGCRRREQRLAAVRADSRGVCDRARSCHPTPGCLTWPLGCPPQVPLERDRQKVVVQITQNLSSRIRNKHAFELPCLYIPDQSAPPSKVRAQAKPLPSQSLRVLDWAGCPSRILRTPTHAGRTPLLATLLP
mgnify:CR=1 FL=1